MRIIVQKFGGTSLSDKQKRISAAKMALNAKNKGLTPVIVVSAIGRKGDAYATDTFIDFANSISGSTEARELDLIMSVGEIISAVIMANTLKSMGCEAVALTGGQAGIITNESYGMADIIEVRPDNIKEYIRNGKVPVIAGFQGASKCGEITTLGRGGSDTTAAILGEALGAEMIEIYTDVDGIMTADPRIVRTACKLEFLSYSELLQMANHGAKVIHPSAVAIAMRSGIPIVIKNVESDSKGTLIRSRQEMGIAYNNGRRAVTSVTHMTGRAQIDVCYDTGCIGEEILRQIAENRISIDMINIFPGRMVFTIDEKHLSRIREILTDKNVKFAATDNLSKVSVVGELMHGTPGIMYRIIRALTERSIKVLQTSDSHMTISCLISAEETVKAVTALHDEFRLGTLTG
ncbi:MAG TPA: aspartate kinase [Candidatus Atribacteria bacterium]|nr:aspartate kinase [Candidatus Atribacteria bacterium]